MNKSHMKVNCDRCGEKVAKFKHLKKLNCGFVCGKCVRDKRAEHREFLKRKVCGIRKRSDMEKEWREKRERGERLKRMLVRQGKPIVPQIKSVRKDKPKISALGLYITKNEKLVLYRKLVGSGLDSKSANARVNNLCEQMGKTIEKLRETVKTKEELRDRFREEFAKLMEEENGS